MSAHNLQNFTTFPVVIIVDPINEKSNTCDLETHWVEVTMAWGLI